MSFEKFKESNEILKKDPISDLLKIESDNLDKILSEKEAELIIIPHLKNNTSDNSYNVTEDKFINILEKLNSRIVSNILGSLASKEIIEMAFDNEINDFVFWIKNKKGDK